VKGWLHALWQHSAQLCAVLLATLFAAAAQAQTTWVVGPKPPAMSLREALATAASGDTIAVLEGEYDGQVGVVTQDRLTIKGIGRQPVLRAGGRHAEGRGMFVLRGGHVTFDNLELRGTRVPDGTGAAIRLEKGSVTVRRCLLADNEHGLVALNLQESVVEIEDSLFTDAPQVSGSLPHLLHVGRIARLTITGSRFHDGFEGHLIKSRARENHIAYNMIFDGWRGNASYELDFPAGGVVHLLGNVIGQGQDPANRALIAYGGESSAWPQSELIVVHNTLITHGLMPSRFLRVFDEALPAKVPVVVVNNVLAGVAVLAPFTEGRFAGNPRTLARWLREPGYFDFALPPQSSLRAKAVDLKGISELAGRDFSPRFEFTMPLGKRPLAAPAAGARAVPGAIQSR
jgi:hypothetical protein